MRASGRAGHTASCAPRPHRPTPSPPLGHAPPRPPPPIGGEERGRPAGRAPIGARPPHGSSCGMWAGAPAARHGGGRPPRGQWRDGAGGSDGRASQRGSDKTAAAARRPAHPPLRGAGCVRGGEVGGVRRSGPRPGAQRRLLPARRAARRGAAWPEGTGRASSGTRGPFSGDWLGQRRQAEAGSRCPREDEAGLCFSHRPGQPPPSPRCRRWVQVHRGGVGGYRPLGVLGELQRRCENGRTLVVR